METGVPPPRRKNRRHEKPRAAAVPPLSKKRKKSSTDTAEEELESAKLSREGDECWWKNLRLILSLQDKNATVLKKVDLAFDYVNSSNTKGMDDISCCLQVLDTSRTIIFLNNWVQSVLISSGKNTKLKENKHEPETSASLLDLRCWKILHFCLEESKNMLVPLTLSKDFLRVIHFIALDASACVNNASLFCEGKLQVYNAVLDCISLVFSSHGGVANENLDLWILPVDKVLELILKIADGSSKLGDFVLQLSTYLFEPFAKFLRAHPTKKNGFHNFIDKLLEPLLHLLHILRSTSCFSNNNGLKTKLTELLQEVIAQGLFHPTHIDGFLILQSSVRYKNSSDATVKEDKLVNKSYHRHLFDKVEKIVAEKNGLALIGLGELLNLFVSCVTKHKGVLVTELRRSVFDYFVQNMECLLTDLNKLLQSDGEEVSFLFNVYSTLRSINNLLSSFLSDKLYSRIEDTSEGASINFLKSIYAVIMSVSARITHQKMLFLDSDDKSRRELLISVRKELIVIIHHLLNIEYEVVGDDLETVWSMTFSSAACCDCSMDVLSQPLFSEILRLGCRLIDLYSELRQVGSSIYALCRATKNFYALIGENKEAYNPSGLYSSYSNSLSMLFHSSEFRLSLSNAIKAIPEGQSSGCIRHLSLDIKESLQWMRLGHQLADSGEIKDSSNSHKCDSQFHLRAEVLGKVLCEAYTIILDSMTLTSGNSYLVGVSLKSLLEIIRSSLSTLQSDISSKELTILVDGCTLNTSTGCDNVSMCWILTVFFRLMMSCTSLFQQAISLMPSEASKKISGLIGDSFTVKPGNDLLKKAVSAAKGSIFSWITQSSSSLFNVICSVSDICIRDSSVLCSPLVYLLNTMALQRVVELNLLIKYSDCLLQQNQSQSKSIAKLEKRSTKMRKEAADLTQFMMGFLSSTAKDKTVGQGLRKIHALNNIDVGALDEKSLPSALWWVICHNVDIWCSHAAKKDLKKFLTLLIEDSLFCITNHDSQSRKKVTADQIELALLNNTISHVQTFIPRDMASRFCRTMQKSVLSIFATSGVDLSMQPDWVEFISEVESLCNAQIISSLPWRKTDALVAESFYQQINPKFDRCQCLLTLLMQMPEAYLSLKSSLYITYILNLERLLVNSLLECDASSSHNPYQIFQLFVTCRRVLRILTAASSRDNVNGSQYPLSSFPLPWLLKSSSAVIGFLHPFPDDIAFEAKIANFQLLDYTSEVMLTVCKDQFQRAIQTVDPETMECDTSACNIQSEEVSDAMQSVLQIAEAFEEHLEKSLTTSRDASLQDLNKLSSILACFQGLLWGLASAVSNTNEANGNSRINFSKFKAEVMTNIKSCVDTCMKFMTFFLEALFLEDDPTLYMSASGQHGDLKKKFSPTTSDIEAFLTKVQHQKLCLKTSLLVEVARGENAEAALFLGQLFISFSAILRLNSQIDLTLASWSLFPIVVDISQFLLREFSRSEMPHQFAFWGLEGAVSFFEELACYFPQFKPSSSRDFYVKLINLHMRAIGKCISLQEKEARLGFSQVMGSHVKKVGVQSSVSWSTRKLEGFKKRLRMSFRTYVKKSSEFHLLSAIQAVERALVGVQEGLMTNYEIVFGSSSGGEVSSVVAAGIDCLDTILEFVTGPKRLNMIKRHIQSLVACLFNVILHLQGPTIFYRDDDSTKAQNKPDSGAVILMCVERLTKISGKPSRFQVDACHITASLRVPGALFQHFLQLQIKKGSAIDREFSVELFAACCRMLCTALKHHKSETLQFMAILEDSVSVLLHCLESVNVDRVAGRKYFAWEVHEAVKCAGTLRRVYEEVKQQKDIFGKYSFQFLSRYIWVYCGLGPSRNGIIREVDEALKPGVYALIDSCSADDLQYLHTVFGEGPCRITLAALQHDYKINFQFGGKV